MARDSDERIEILRGATEVRYLEEEEARRRKHEPGSFAPSRLDFHARRWRAASASSA